MTSLGFENYAEALKIYLSKYREVSFLINLIFFGESSNIDNRLQTQSTRGENQGRPGSQGGFGAGGAGGSGVSANATSSTAFPGGSEGANNVLGGQQPEGTEQDPGSYGALYGGQTGHNGATGGEY